MQQLVYALNDIKQDLQRITRKLSAVDRVIKTGDVSQLMTVFGQSQTPQIFGPQASFGGQGISSPWSATPQQQGGRRRNRGRKRQGQQNLFGGQQFAGGQQVPYNQHAAQLAQLTAQYLLQMQKNGVAVQSPGS